MKYLWDIRYVTETAMNPRRGATTPVHQSRVSSPSPKWRHGNPEIGINIQMQADQCVHFVINILVTYNDRIDTTVNLDKKYLWFIWLHRCLEKINPRKKIIEERFTSFEWKLMIQQGICKKRLSVYHSWIFDLNFGPERFSQSILASHFVPIQWQPASLVLHNDNLTSGTYLFWNLVIIQVFLEHFQRFNEDWHAVR